MILTIEENDDRIILQCVRGDGAVMESKLLRWQSEHPGEIRLYFDSETGRATIEDNCAEEHFGPEGLGTAFPDWLGSRHIRYSRPGERVNQTAFAALRRVINNHLIAGLPAMR